MNLTDSDYQGLGVYDFGPPMGQLPGLPKVADMVTVEGGLKVIRGQYRAAAVQLLDGMTLKITSESPALIRGQAVVIVGVLGSGWASDYIKRGFVVMALISTIESGSPTVLISSDPATIAQAAAAAERVNGVLAADYVIVEGASAPMEAARGILLLQVKPLCPEGMSMTPAGCKPFPSGVEECPEGMIMTADGTCKQQTKPAEPGLPSWLIPAAVGVGVLVLAAALMKG